MTWYLRSLMIAAPLFWFPSATGAVETSACLELAAVTKSKILKKLDPFWRMDHEVLVTNSTGASAPLTFSFDAETSVGLLLFHAFRDPVAKRSLFEFIPRISRSKLLEVFKCSDKQLSFFVLRRASDIDPNAESYGLDALNASSLDKLFPNAESLDAFIPPRQFFSWRAAVIHICSESFLRQRIPLVADFDVDSPEIRLLSFEVTPARFAQLVAYMERSFPGFHMHFHLGISRIVSDMATLTVARALETRVTLGLASWDAEDRSRLSFSVATNFNSLSAWVNDRANERRSLVRLMYKGFPNGSHDLELRQYDSLADGMNLIAQAARLLVLNGSLVESPPGRVFGADNKFEFDPFSGNVDGSLEYAAFLFEATKDPELVALAGKVKQARLAYLATKIGHLDRFPLEGRSALRQFLIDHGILAHFNDEVFLRRPD